MRNKEEDFSVLAITVKLNLLMDINVDFTFVVVSCQGL